jgi:hypothetical protein
MALYGDARTFVLNLREMLAHPVISDVREVVANMGTPPSPSMSLVLPIQPRPLFYLTYISIMRDVNSRKNELCEELLTAIVWLLPHMDRGSPHRVGANKMHHILNTIRSHLIWLSL